MGGLATARVQYTTWIKFVAKTNSYNSCNGCCNINCCNDDNKVIK